MAVGHQQAHGTQQAGEEHEEQGNFLQTKLAGPLYPAIKAAIDAGGAPQQVAAQFGEQYLHASMLQRMMVQQLLTANGHAEHSQAFALKGVPGM